MLRALRPFTLPAILLAVTGAPSAQSATPSFGHARARELADLGQLPTARDIVVRDLVNYHRHRLPLPKAGQEVALDVRFDRAAVTPGDEVWLQVGYTTAPQGDRALATPCAVALVIDCSGSMAEAGKMTAVQAGLRAFVSRLRADDEVALITFSSDAEVLAPRARRGDGRWLDDAINRLQPGGSTNLHAGLRLGLQQLARDDDGPRSRRVVLLTDGIANRGVTEPNRMLDDVRPLTATGIDIATIGVGQNLDVSLLQRLAEGTHGLFHFVADAVDVEKVFVDEADALLAPVARRVHLSIRLPGFDIAAAKALHEGVSTSATTLEVDLPDLNAGVTGVVIVRCPTTSPARGRLEAEAVMTFRGAASGRDGSERAIATLQRASGNEGEPDLEVRKNASIAVLAQGLADMARSCDAKRWADADRTLRLANDDARHLFPGEDADLQRVRDIVAGHQKTLARYVDRFRDL